MLAKYVSTKKEAWSSYLDNCVFAYNTSCHESTKFTPFELMFSRKATLPVDIEFQNASPEELCQKYHSLDDPNVSSVMKEHVQCLEAAKQNILVAQQKQKSYYDKKHAKPENFQVNQLVLKKDFTRKKCKGGKLNQRYLGPYKITKLLPCGTYELSDKSKIIRATGAHLKLYTAPSPLKHPENKTSFSPSIENECLSEMSSHLSSAIIESLKNESLPNAKNELSKSDTSESSLKQNTVVPRKTFFHSLKLDGNEMCPQNKSFQILPPCSNELQEEEEYSFLNSSIPLLPPPMPSLQLIRHLPFPPSAPLACSTPRVSSHPNSLAQDSQLDLEAQQARSGNGGRKRLSLCAPQHCKKLRGSCSNGEKRNVKVKEMMFKRRQMKRSATTVEKPDVVDVDQYRPSKKCQGVEIWIQELSLSERDREILLNPAGLLTDTIINAAQMLLKQEFPSLSGLQSVACGLVMNFNIEPDEFVQILHNGQGHWLTISTIGTSHPVVHVYDSMYPSASTLVKAQIATILHTVYPTITLQFMDVQMQAGVYDCGLFAVAFLVSLALGKSPGQYHFHQDKMRQHLWRCFQNRKLSMFPYSKLRRATESSVKAVEEVHVFCICRMPELPNTKWIECSGCKNWYHRDTCVCVPPTALITNIPWFCIKCM